jgi:Tfp pilus assembly protein PilN
MSVNPNQRGNANKLTINLLQPELLPEKVLLTLTRVVIVWFLMLLFVIGWALQTNYTQRSFKAKLAVLQQENAQHTQKQNTLAAQLSARKVDRELTDKLNTIKLLMTNKTALHAKLTNPNHTYVAGFASAMDDLAQLHHEDIRLKFININNDHMTFAGLALTPEAVPAWLAGFENSLLLSGKSFSHFKLSENEQNITEFMVSSKEVFLDE